MQFQTTQISVLAKVLSTYSTNKWLPFTLYPGWLLMTESRASAGIRGLIPSSFLKMQSEDWYGKESCLSTKWAWQTKGEIPKWWSKEEKITAGAVCLHMRWAGSCKSREENELVAQVKHPGCQATCTHITPLASPPDLWASFLAKLPE